MSAKISIVLLILADMLEEPLHVLGEGRRKAEVTDRRIKIREHNFLADRLFLTGVRARMRVIHIPTFFLLAGQLTPARAAKVTGQRKLKIPFLPADKILVQSFDSCFITGFTVVSFVLPIPDLIPV